MNLFQELRQRRVPQIASAYMVGSWGLLQFLAFLEGRMAISPHLVNLVGLTLLFLLPSLVTLAWVHGKPGKDTWGRTPKVVLPANVLAVGLLLLFLFNGRDLGAVTETIAVEDENGAVTERVVPKSEYRRRILIFYPENGGDPADNWAREALAFLLTLDLSQDGFVDPTLPLAMPGTIQDAGSPDGHGLPRPLKRKLTRDAHIAYFLTGSVTRQGDQWRLDTELHESESGKIVADHTLGAGSLFDLTDQASRQLREDLGIPAAHLENNIDLPVAELTSQDITAVASHVAGVLAITHFNNWADAEKSLVDAVERDPQYAIAQNLLSNVRHILGDTEGAATATAAAMSNIYRVPERLAFMIKAAYYYNQEQDADKAMAVLRMWSQIYPNDVDAYAQQATFYKIRQDLPGAIAAYEQILAIDPSRVTYLEELADLHTQLGNLTEAEAYLQRYVDIYPSRAEGYQDLAGFYSKTGRLDEARDALAKAQLLEPGDLGLSLNLIDLDIKTGRYDACEQALADLFETAGSPRDRLRIRARQVNLASLRGNADHMISILEAFYAASLEVQNPLQANLAYSVTLPIISQAGRPLDALSRLAEVRSRVPAPYTDLVGLGEAWVYADMGRTDEARTALAANVVVVDAFKFETFRSSVLLVEGLIREADGDLEAAIPYYRQAVDKAMHVTPIYSLHLARSLRLAGETKDAQKVLQAALKLEPAHPELHLEMAHLEAGRGNLTQAQTHLTRVLSAWSGAGPEYQPAQEARALAEKLKAS